MIRPRRLRAGSAIRAMVREHHVRIDQLVQPLFIVEIAANAGEIPSMPGIHRYTVDAAVAEAKVLFALGVQAVLLFGIPEHKDAIASSNYDPNGVVQQAIRAIKAAVPQMLVIADLCNCEYTDHGHCGIIDASGNIDNDASVALLVKAALTYARSGVDIIAPSDMMDGRVGAIRRALDEAGFESVSIMAYSAKYASAFYGPFRDAAGSTPAFGDRRTYQMDPPNEREAMREIALDIEEGADIVMVKPGLAYLDIVRAARESFDLPIAVYNVSGEYSMLKAAIANGWLDEHRAIDELLVSFVRAGADIIITYFAKDYAARNK
ncbi:MAG: porphobilinogen synthase [Candidatus Eremiobacteraeota bacterium]|nr:porphobilinogen synthase [Candidatus Eremiobacteraeota bacterium]